jgi:hypothetical protein
MEVSMYFESPGKVNTHQTLTAALEKARELGLDEVVVASTSGETAFAVLELFEGFGITAVTYHCGFLEPFKPIMLYRTRKQLEEKGVSVISATHALSGVERAVAKKHGGVYPALLIADTLKLFGQGTKVAVEVSIMAADAGTLTGNDIITIGGSSKGADTALVVKPANQSTLFDLRIREIICKPRHFKMAT